MAFTFAIEIQGMEPKIYTHDNRMAAHPIGMPLTSCQGRTKISNFIEVYEQFKDQNGNKG